MDHCHHCSKTALQVCAHTMARTKQTCRMSEQGKRLAKKQQRQHAIFLTQWGVDAKHIFCLCLYRLGEYDILKSYNTTPIEFDILKTILPEKGKKRPREEFEDDEDHEFYDNFDEEEEQKEEERDKEEEQEEEYDYIKYYTEAYTKAKEMIDYIDYSFQKNHRKRIYTPIRSFLHLELIKANGTLHLHPWAQILEWINGQFKSFDTVSLKDDYLNSAFTPMQRMDMPLYSLQLIYKVDSQIRHSVSAPYIMLTSKCAPFGLTRRFFPYKGNVLPLELDTLPLLDESITTTRSKFDLCVEDPDKEIDKLKDTINVLETCCEYEKRLSFDDIEILRKQNQDEFKKIVETLGYGGYMTENGLIYMPIYSFEKFEEIKYNKNEKVLKSYPWMQFLILYFESHPDFEYNDGELFTPLQRLDTQLYSVQFVYQIDYGSEPSHVPYVLVTDKHSGRVYFFFLYGNGECIQEDTGKSIHLFQAAIIERPSSSSSSSSSSNSSAQEEKEMGDQFHDLYDLITTIEEMY